MNHKGLIIVMDGLGDRPIAKLNNKTPLENARTPFFDQLVSKGMAAMVNPLIPGIPVSTHTGMALIMGLPIKEAVNLARGPVEAAGIDLSVKQGDVVLRCNFAHVEKVNGQLNVLDRRAGRINESRKELAEAISQIDLPYEIQGNFYPTTQHRAVLHLQGQNLSAQVTDTDCSRTTPVMLQTSRPLANSESARITAEAINHFSFKAHQILLSHPVNEQRISLGKIPATGILCRSAGQIKTHRNMLDYYHLNVAVISAEATVIGLAKLFGFTTVNKPEFTALFNTDVKAKVESAMQALENHDLVYLHIKATDICSHDHQPELKSQIIEKIDSALGNIDISNTVIAVTADHSTDSNIGLHCGDPVPSILYSPFGRSDTIKEYSENSCMYGGLGNLSAYQFLTSVLDQMGVIHNFKAEDIPYLCDQLEKE